MLFHNFEFIFRNFPRKYSETYKSAQISLNAKLAITTVTLITTHIALTRMVVSYVLVNLVSRVTVSRLTRLQYQVPVVPTWTIVSTALVVVTRIQIFASVVLMQSVKRLQDHTNVFVIQLDISQMVPIVSMRMSA